MIGIAQFKTISAAVKYGRKINLYYPAYKEEGASDKVRLGGDTSLVPLSELMVTDYQALTCKLIESHVLLEDFLEMSFSKQRKVLGLVDLDDQVVVSSGSKSKSDVSTADYYELPNDNPKQLQDLIAFRNMNGQVAEIFRACYRYGEVEHSEKLRDAKKMRFYADAEVKRLEKYGE